MVEKRPLLAFLSHLTLMLRRRGDRDSRSISRSSPRPAAPTTSCRAWCRCCPAPHAIDNYWEMISTGISIFGRAADRHDDVQLADHGAVDRHRQDRDLDHLGLRHRLFPLSLPGGGLLGDLHHADAAGGGAHRADLQGGRRSRHAQQLCRPVDPADRLGHGHLPVPPGLSHRARRTDGGGARRRRRAAEVLLGHAAAA